MADTANAQRGKGDGKKETAAFFLVDTIPGFTAATLP
jgi:hypothetical protein